MNSLPPDSKSLDRALLRQAPIKYLRTLLGDFLVYAVACLVITAAAAGAAVFILHLNK